VPGERQDGTDGKGLDDPFLEEVRAYHTVLFPNIHLSPWEQLPNIPCL